MKKKPQVSEFFKKHGFKEEDYEEATDRDYTKMMSDEELNPVQDVYYLSIDGGSAPSIAHDDEESAIEEAKRLAKKTDKVVRVLKQIATVTREESYEIEFYG